MIGGEAARALNNDLHQQLALEQAVLPLADRATAPTFVVELPFLPALPATFQFAPPSSSHLPFLCANQLLDASAASTYPSACFLRS